MEQKTAMAVTDQAGGGKNGLREQQSRFCIADRVFTFYLPQRIKRTTFYRSYMLAPDKREHLI
nr:hypothetical protein [Morganella morganii]